MTAKSGSPAQPQTAAVRDRIAVIELAGAPGSGKTTLLPAVTSACAEAGFAPYTVVEAARVFAARTRIGRLACRLPVDVRPDALWIVFVMGRAMAAVAFCLTRPRLALLVLRSQWRRPAGADVRERRALGWWLRNAGAHRFLTALGRSGEVLVIDEGFVHRVVQLYTSPAETPDPEVVADYVRLVPRADVVVVIEAPPDVCRSRVRGRGVWERLAHRSIVDIDRFISNAHGATGIAAAEMRAVGWLVVRIENTSDVSEAEEAVRRAVGEALVTGKRWDATRRPIVWAPRPARVREWARARREPAVIERDVCEAVLGRYGLSGAGRPANLPLGRRNAKVILETSAGRKVLRRYRSSTPSESILHEHAVLSELERLRFPAVRLVRTRSGETVVEHEGWRYSLLDLADGINLAATSMPRSSRLTIVTTAGRTLARLHMALDGFVPIMGHHLSHDPSGEEAAQGLKWYLEKLEDLARRRPQAEGRALRHHMALAGRHRHLASELARLDDVLRQAQLPRATIHGDYGLHNLLYRSDGTAVVTDFELARLEHRLVDLVVAMSTMRIDVIPSFLDGYRSGGDLPEAEWRHLSAVWQHYRLTGAVRSWDNYFTHGGEHRLATAWMRVEEAAWAKAEVTAGWP